jgi:integrase
VLQVVPLSGAVCLDEVFFKEMACQVLGIVMVDPLTGLVLRLERCRVHPHIWRKAFATAFVDNGGDAERLRVFMGWSSTEMAVVYVDSSLKRLQETHQRVGDCFHVRESVSSQ